MKQGYLSQYFSGVAFKRLSAVEARPERSNQHEFQGISKLREILGIQKRTKTNGNPFPSVYVRLQENGDPVVVKGSLSWYDSREGKPRSAEWHLYYDGNAITSEFQTGDIVIVAKRPDESLLLLTADQGSTGEQQLIWLFGLSGKGDTARFQIETSEFLGKRQLEFSARQILEQIGVEIVETDTSWLERLHTKFGLVFPTTIVFSQFAREVTPDVDAVADPDETLIAWMDQEEMLFRTFERHILAERLKQGFKDVDEFISVSLSVQNRRKSRVGFALENHLAALFDGNGIRYAHGVATELNSKPDFIFPGLAEYKDLQYSASRLTMLGAKTTCKDRWRQVLAEATRIPEKHLVTLESGISENQTREMAASNLRLVVPRAIHATFNELQRQWLLDMQAFIGMVRGRQ